MASTGVQVASFDAWTRSDQPTLNLGATTTIGLGGGADARGYLYFALPPALPGDTIISATLKLYQVGVASGGSRTLTVQRCTQAWTESKITYGNQPTGTATGQATRTLGDGGVSGRLWEFDVTAMVAAVAAGAQWFGFRIQSNNGTGMHVYSSESTVYQPTLEITYSPNADIPTNLRPDSGNAVSVASPLLQWDSVLAEAISAYRVQVSTDPAFGSTVEDSGQVFSNLPEHQMTFALTAGTTYYWRVKIWNEAGLASAYSAAATFTRTAKSSLTIDNPAASPNNYVTEATPPFGWTFGGTQTKFEVEVWDVTGSPVVLHDSTPIAGTANSYSPPTSIAFATGRTYRVYVRAWDDVARAGTPGDPPYVQASRDFTFQPQASVSPVATIVAATDTSPYVALTVTRATAPDFFQVFDGGTPISGLIEPADVFVSGTTYEINVVTLNPRVAYTALTVAAIVNGVTSSANPTVSVTTEPEGIWLCDRFGDNPVVINSGSDIGSWSTSEVSAVHQPIGAKYPVVLFQTGGARSGEVAGDLVGEYPGTETISADQWRTRLEALTEPLGQKLILTLTDTTIPVYVRKVVISPSREFIYSDSGEIPVSFEFHERAPD